MSKKPFVFLFALALAVAVTPAFAGKGGNGNGNGGSAPSASSSSDPSISIASVNGGVLAASTQSPAVKYGDKLTFNTNDGGALSGNQYPAVGVSCYQDVNHDGTIDTSVTGPDIVYSWLDHPDATFPLGGSTIASTWSGGTATCHADLYAYSMTGKGETITWLAGTGNFTASAS